MNCFFDREPFSPKDPNAFIEKIEGQYPSLNDANVKIGAHYGAKLYSLLTRTCLALLLLLSFANVSIACDNDTLDMASYPFDIVVTELPTTDPNDWCISLYLGDDTEAVTGLQAVDVILDLDRALASNVQLSGQFDNTWLTKGNAFESDLSLLNDGTQIHVSLELSNCKSANGAGLIGQILIGNDNSSARLAATDGGSYVIIDNINGKKAWEQPSFQNAELYPNPAQEFFRVDGQGRAMAVLEVWGLDGTLIERRKPAEEKPLISVQDYPEGLYLVRMHWKDGQVETQKLRVAK